MERSAPGEERGISERGNMDSYLMLTYEATRFFIAQLFLCLSPVPNVRKENQAFLEYSFSIRMLHSLLLYWRPVNILNRGIFKDII